MNREPEPVKIFVFALSETPARSIVPVRGYVVAVLITVPLFSSPAVRGSLMRPLSSRTVAVELIRPLSSLLNTSIEVSL